MKPDEYGQYSNGINYPMPVFVLTGPGHLKVVTPDELSERLAEMNPAGYKVAVNMAIYIKLPMDSSLIPVRIRFDDHGDHWALHVEYEMDGVPVVDENEQPIILTY